MTQPGTARNSSKSYFLTPQHTHFLIPSWKTGALAWYRRLLLVGCGVYLAFATLFVWGFHMSQQAACDAAAATAGGALAADPAAAAKRR